MGYTKTMWEDWAVEFPNRFDKSGETATQVMLTPNVGTVTQTGTPINATNMNNLEQGVADAHKKTSGIAVGGDCNNALTTGTYSFSPTDINSPFQGGYGILQVMVSTGDTHNNTNNWCYQLGFSTANNAMRVRHKINNSVWSAWVDIAAGDAPFTTTGGSIRFQGSTDRIIDFLDDSSNRVGFMGRIESGNPKGMWIRNQVSGKNLELRDNGEIWYNGNLLTDPGGDLWVRGTAMAPTRLNGTIMEYWNGGAWTPVGGVKNVQRGTSSLLRKALQSSSVTNITISSINTSKAFLVVSFGDPDTSKSVRGRLTSATNIEFTLSHANSSAPDDTSSNVSWEVVESY